MNETTYASYFVVAAEGHRIGLMTCLRCGALVLVGEDNATEIHDAWHAALSPLSQREGDK